MNKCHAQGRQEEVTPPILNGQPGDENLTGGVMDLRPETLPQVFRTMQIPLASWVTLGEKGCPKL